MLKAPLPEGAQFDGDVRLCVEADLHPDGSFGREWLVVAGDRLHVLSRNGSGMETRHEFPLSGLSEIKAENLVGGGALEVNFEGKPLELVRYTNGKVPAFSTAAGLLDKWGKGEEAAIPQGDANRCERCGLPLEHGTQVCPACMPKSQTIARIAGYLRPYWKQALALSLLATVNTALGLVPPYLQKPLIDGVLSPKEGYSTSERLRLLGVLTVTLLAVRIMISGVSIMQGWLATWVGSRTTHDIRSHLYERLQYLSFRFFDKRQMGSVISRVNQDSTHLHEFLVWGSQDLIINALLLLGIGTVLFMLNWRLAFFVLIPTPIVVILWMGLWNRIRHYLYRFFHRWGRLNAVLNESLTGLRIVKAFAQERRVIDRFRERSDDLAKASVQVERIWISVFSSMSLLIMMGTLLVWYVGGRYVLFEDMSLGTLISFLAYVGMFYAPIQALSMLLNWTSRSLTAADRVFEVVDSKPDVQEAENPVPMPKLEGHVEFRGVKFGYDKHSPVLKNISFDIKPGEMIGLVGQSGAGKSTTINLLCRFYDVDEGEILIDGVPIKDIAQDDLRHQIGLVPQDTFLFSGTIAENIAYAKPDATKEEVIRAARIANAHDFIRQKPDGYETLVGERGEGLSAGERQRIAIARAVLHNPRILILDEATSAVDVETEVQIQEAIDRLVKSRTTFAIAHRLSTLKNADRLVVLKGGEVAEMGRHDELMANEEGEFHRLVKAYQEVSKVKALDG